MPDGNNTGIEPIGVLLNTYEKRAAYQSMLDNFDELIPYVGAGLSYYSKSWGAPFDAILKALRQKGASKDNYFFENFTKRQKERAIDVLKELAVENESEVNCIRDCLKIAFEIVSIESTEDISFFIIPDTNSKADNDVIWNSMQLLYDNDCFLELGEMLDIISYIDTGKRFNRLFLQEIKKMSNSAQQKIKEEIEQIKSLKYLGNLNSLPPAIWYLPYLGNSSKYVFTTNTDCSLKDIYREMGRDTITFTGRSNEHDISENEGNHHIIFHIHGYQYGKNYDTSDTFVMTWLDYKKVYVLGEGSQKRMLIKKFKEGHFLFVGASLKKDTTVSLMKEQANLDDIIDRHIALMSGKEFSEEDDNELDVSMATQIVRTPHWSMYPVVLCNLIREKRIREWLVYKDIIDGKTISNADKEDELVGELSSFLCNDANYLVFHRKLKNDEIIDKLYPILKELLVENNTRIYDWSVCRVNTQQFGFPIKDSEHPSLDSYSAPLGNTIYILGGSRCTNDQIDELEKKIHLWTEQHGSTYWNTQVKVRVIKVDCVEGLSPIEIINQLKDLLKLSEEKEIAEKLLMDLIQKINGYETYTEMLPFRSMNDAICYLEKYGVICTILFILFGMDRVELFQEYKSQIKNLQEVIIPIWSKNELEDTKVKRLVPDINVVKMEGLS